MAVNHFLRGTHDQINSFLGKLAQLSVGQGVTLFQNAERPDNWTASPETLDPDGEVQMTPLGLCARVGSRCS